MQPRDHYDADAAVAPAREDLQIRTERLDVFACPLAVAEGLRRDRREAEQLLQARLPDGWPDDELAEFLPLYAALLRNDARSLGYGVWLLVERRTPMVVGSAGFHGLPDAEGSVEIGYGIHPDHRNRGYATEAVRALVRWALEQDEVTRVTAHCDPSNIPSVRVAANAGMVAGRDRDGGPLWTTR